MKIVILWSLQTVVLGATHSFNKSHNWDAFAAVSSEAIWKINSEAYV